MKRKINKKIIFALSAVATASVVSATTLFSVSCGSNVTIYARNYNGDGITMIEYEQEKYINDNSFSMLINSTPNLDYLKEYSQQYTNANSEHDPGKPQTPENGGQQNGGEQKPSNPDNTNPNHQQEKITKDLTDDNWAYFLMKLLNRVLTEQTQTPLYQVFNIDMGTGWILDYSSPGALDSQNSNLATYYLATNLHVLDANYKVEFSVAITPQNSTRATAAFKGQISVPISSQTVNDVSIYLSQPQGNKGWINKPEEKPQISPNSHNKKTNSLYSSQLSATKELEPFPIPNKPQPDNPDPNKPSQEQVLAPNNLCIPANANQLLPVAWHKTSINKTNFTDSIIPVGTFAASTGIPTNSDEYDLSGTIIGEYLTETGPKTVNKTYYYYTGTSSTPPQKTKVVNSYSLAPAMSPLQSQDFSVFKIKDSANNIKIPANPYPNLNWNFNDSFAGLQKMFELNTNITKKTDIKNTTYISRLNFLNNYLQTQTSIDKRVVDKMFMFQDYKKMNDNTDLSIAGFPLTDIPNIDKYPANSPLRQVKVANFNSNTLSFSLCTMTGNTNDVVGKSRPSVEFTNNGKFRYQSYDWRNNIIMPNVDLKPGSSGSMITTDDYKLVGIHWGIITDNATGQKSGVGNVLYSPGDENSPLFKYLKYIQRTDKNSQLLKLFTSLEKINYF